MTKSNYKTPPRNSLCAWRWADFPDAMDQTSYRVQHDGKDFEITISRHMRQVLEALINAPLFAASFCRLSDQVLLLREMGVEIETKMYRNDPVTGRSRYGVYLLESNNTRLTLDKVVA